MAEPTCALWYWSHHSVFVELCDDEKEAAESAVTLENSEEGAPAGIQYADGRYVDRDQWAAYQAEHDRRFAEMMQNIRDSESKPRPAVRKVTPPFETRYGQTATVLADAPSWLGRQSLPHPGSEGVGAAPPSSEDGPGPPTERERC